jgi:hypothetical protein
LPSLVDDVSADSTFTDLEPITGEIAVVADEPSSVELSSTDLEDEMSADATGEIDAVDILDVASALRTSRLPALSLDTSRLPVVTPRMPSVAPVAPRPSYPSSSAMIAARQPSSIAPFALDVTGPMRPSFPSSPTSTLQIARAAGLPGVSPRVVMVAASVLGMCVFAAVAGAALGYSRPTRTASSGGAAPAEGPRVAVLEPAREAVTLPLVTAASKDPAAPGEASDEAVVASTTPAQAPRAPVVHTSPAPHPARSNVVASSTGSGNLGTIRVSAPLSGILVDGTPHKVNGGAVVVSCGRHMVKAPGQSARLVIVPCGGRATF